MRSVNSEKESQCGDLSFLCSWVAQCEGREGGEEAGMSNGNETFAA